VSVDLMEMWHTMGWFAKGIVWILFFMSIMVATVAIQRWWEIRKAISKR
jgi:biopolymer transport protein ExbB/biopolymer transport protein TolQ